MEIQGLTASGAAIRFMQRQEIPQAPIPASGLWLRTGLGRLLQFIQLRHHPLLDED